LLYRNNDVKQKFVSLLHQGKNGIDGVMASVGLSPGRSKPKIIDWLIGI